jgi:hypothetical protein
MGLASYHFGAIHPFLPDPHQYNWREAAETWRVSELSNYPLTSQIRDGSIDVDAPYRGHPWLLVTSSSGMTPSSAIVRDSLGFFHISTVAKGILTKFTYTQHAE